MLQRLWRGALIAAVALSIGAVAIATADETSGSVRAVAWPVVVSYQLDYQAEPEAVDLARAEFLLQANGWTSWKQVQTCCGPDTGFILELRSDGSVWSGGDRGTGVALVFYLEEPSEGMVPLFDFAPRFAATRQGLAEDPRVTITGDTITGTDVEAGRAEVLAAASRLRLDPSDIVAYRVDQPAAGDNAYIDRIVYLPLNLVLSSSEVADGVQTRLLTVLSIQPGTGADN